MKIYDIDTALRIMDDIYLFNTPVEEAIANEIILEMRIPWNSEINVMDVFEAIMKKAHETGKSPDDFEWHIGGEFLWCNGEKCKRVLPMFYYCDFDPRADYYEGLILDRAVRAGYFD